LFEHLRALRKSLADERNAPAFVIFSDATLRDMARRRPSSISSFMAVHGIGQKKCEDFGETFTRAVREYCEAHGLDMDVEPAAEADALEEAKPKPRKKPGKPSRTM